MPIIVIKERKDCLFIWFFFYTVWMWWRKWNWEHEPCHNT